MSLIVRAPVALFAQEQPEAMKRHQMPASIVAPGLMRAAVDAFNLDHHAPVSLDFKHQPAHFRVLGPDLSQFALRDRAEVGEAVVVHGRILDIKTVFLHAPGHPSSAADARQSSKETGATAHGAAFQAGGRAPVKPGDHVGNDLGGDFDKQIAKEVFHGGSALCVGNAHSLLSRPRQFPLVGFPTQFRRGENHHFARLSHFPKASRPTPRQAMNTPTYCRETGRRIGVCPCPLCKPKKPTED